MVEASFFIRTVDIMMDSGKKIKCMDGVNYFIKGDNLLMKEIGLTTSFMGTAKYITIIQLYSREDLTILILTY